MSIEERIKQAEQAEADEVARRRRADQVVIRRHIEALIGTDAYKELEPHLSNPPYVSSVYLDYQEHRIEVEFMGNGVRMRRRAGGGDGEHVREERDFWLTLSRLMEAPF